MVWDCELCESFQKIFRYKMSNCIEDFLDYELDEKWCDSRIIQLESKSHKK